MKVKTLIASFFLAVSTFSSHSMAADYNIDIPGQHAFVTFKASHLGYSFIVGGFNKFSGKFSHDAKNPGDSKVSVSIDTNSIDSNHAERDKHLRSSDFLNVDKYPTITFESTSYTSGASGDTLTGNLTMHGVTKEIEIDVRHIGEGKDPWGGYRSGFVGNVKLKASDYGLPDWVGVLDIELNIEGTRI
ncbi:MAG: YceI family protein [Pseudomonadota bacterium]